MLDNYTGSYKPVASLFVRIKKGVSKPSDKIIVHFLIAIVLVGFLAVHDAINQKSAFLTVEMHGQKRTFQGQLFEGMTLLDALNASMIAGKINFKFDINGGLTRIVEIDGKRGEIEKNDVILFVNDKKVETAMIGVMPVGNKDEILVRINTPDR